MTVACFAIDVGVAKGEKPRIEEWRRIGVRKQKLIPYDVTAMVGVRNSSSGGGEEEKEGRRRELQPRKGLGEYGGVEFCSVENLHGRGGHQEMVL